MASRKLVKKTREQLLVENNTFGAILYRQIAGALARRIVNYAEEGMQIVQGTDAGFIKFGSESICYLLTPIDVVLNQKQLEEKRLLQQRIMNEKELDTRFQGCRYCFK
jgi:phosphatidylserine decarboxylase